MPWPPSRAIAMSKPRCQTCGARAEWLEEYEIEIARLRMALALEIRRREVAERALLPAEPVVTIPIREEKSSLPRAVPVSTIGPKMIQRWSILDEIAGCNASTRMADAFRRAL